METTVLPALSKLMPLSISIHSKMHCQEGLKWVQKLITEEPTYAEDLLLANTVVTATDKRAWCYCLGACMQLVQNACLLMIQIHVCVTVNKFHGIYGYGPTFLSCWYEPGTMLV